MKKSFLLLTTLLSFSIPALSAASDLTSIAPEVSESTVPFGFESRVAASAADLEKIKAHIWGYGAKLGLQKNVEVVGTVGCSPWCSTTFKDAERYLLNDFAGQLLTRFLAMALDDLADGKLDGIAYGKKLSYAQEIAALLGISVSDEDLKSAPVDENLAVRLIGFSIDVTTIILQTGGQKDRLMAAADTFAKEKMDKACKSLAVALIQETFRIVSLELCNGKIDGLDANGMAIDWKKEMQESIERSLARVLDGVIQ